MKQGGVMIYKYGEKYYRMKKKPGEGYLDYALWQPVKKILFFYLDYGTSFWLDTWGFEEA